MKPTMLGSLVAGLVMLQSVSGCPAAPGTGADRPLTAAAPYQAVLTIGFDTPGRAVNRLVLGSNVQWTDGGDHLVSGPGRAFDPTLLAAVRTMGPTILRYPGGSHSDLYHWKNGIGAPAARGTAEHYYAKKAQPIVFGTPELMQLARELNALPLLTVNTGTGTPEEAADWVRQMNVTRLSSGANPPFPAVHYWEIGNEPYLHLDQQPQLNTPPAEFARRANATIRAMRAVDPTISLGLPLRSDQVGAINLPQAVKGYAAGVLGSVTERYDWVAVHNAYFPFLWNPKAGLAAPDVFRALMAAPATVEADLAETRRLLDRYAPGRNVQIGVTEYNALVGLIGREAEWTASLASALYVADLIRVFASREDVLMANYWSLSGNAWFGAVTNWDGRRPQSWVFEAYSRILNGRFVPAVTQAPSFDAPAAGLLAASRRQPLLTALATRDGRVGHAMVVNKSWDAPAAVTVSVTAGRVVAVRILTGAEPFGGSRTWRNLSWTQAAVPAPGQPLMVPAHALAWLEFEATGPSGD